MCGVISTIVCLFALFLWALAFSVLVRITASDQPFCIFNLFYRHMLVSIHTLNLHIIIQIINRLVCSIVIWNRKCSIKWTAQDVFYLQIDLISIPQHWSIVCLFALFLWALAFSVLVRITVSDQPFCIFNLFVHLYLFNKFHSNIFRQFYNMYHFLL
jgi:type IV secretory pathway TrbD component